VQNIGEIESIVRYPVKSFRGEKLLSTTIDENGINGDRIFAFRDCETGFIVSCKHPGKWKKIIELSSRLNQNKLIVIQDDNKKEITNKENRNKTRTAINSK